MAHVSSWLWPGVAAVERGVERSSTLAEAATADRRPRPLTELVGAELRERRSQSAARRGSAA